MSTLLRPLSTAELLDRAFFLYRGHFAVFAGIAAITELPVLALRLGNSALIAARVFVPRPVTISIILVANFLAVAVAHAATVIAVSELHLDAGPVYGRHLRLGGEACCGSFGFRSS
jgi:hypothetical protein